MTKIDVQTPRDKNLVQYKSIYIRLMDVLYGVKLVGGNIFLNKTIANHPKVKDFLLDYLKSDLIDIEREILKLKEEA